MVVFKPLPLCRFASTTFWCPKGDLNPHACVGSRFWVCHVCHSTIRAYKWSRYYVRPSQPSGFTLYTLMHIGILVVNNLPSRQMGVLVGLTQRIDFCAATNLMGSNWKTTILYGITLFYDYKENFLTERISTSNHLIFRGDCSYIYWHTVILSGCSSHSIYHSSFDNSVVVMTLQV